MKIIPEIKNQDKDKCELLLSFLENLGTIDRFRIETKQHKIINNMYVNLLNYVYNLDPDEEIFTEIQEYVINEFNKLEDEHLKWMITHVIFTD